MMKKAFAKASRKLLAVFSAAALFTGCLSGCARIEISKGFGKDELLMEGKEVIGAKEANLYLSTLANEYKAFYSEEESDEGTLPDAAYIKEKSLYRLEHVFAMYLMSKDKGISLSSGEKDSLSDAANEYYSSLNDAEKEYFDITAEDVYSYYERFALADLVFDSVAGDVDLEISDDVARVAKAQVIVTEDSSKSAQIEKALKDGSDFSTVSITYSDESASAVYVKRGDFPDDVVEAIFSLNDDETKGPIEAEGSYYYVKCLERIDDEKTQENRESILNQAYEDAFDAKYEEYLSTLHIEVNEKLWDSMGIPEGEDVTTTSFFSVYNKYL